MRPIHIADLDRPRPAVVLTRELVRPHLRHVTIAPITTTVRGLSTEVPVGPENGLDAAGAVSCDNIVTVPADRLGERIGYLLPSQERDLSRAIRLAFDLEGALDQAGM
jgi:mRNA interferase MazF